jgi:hypothetical protein
MRQTQRLTVCLLVLALASCTASTTTTVGVGAVRQDVFNGLKTIRIGVEGALAVFNAGYQAGTYSEAQRTALGALYQKYLLADTAAADALKATSTTDPATIIGGVTVVAADVIRFIQALKGAP